MSLRNYLLTCAAVTVATAAVILLVPGVAEFLEAQLLGFLSTYASG
ncbi:MAG: hypothetical protein ACE37N_06345 [Pseudohongiellaceae bacterium]